LQFGPVGMLRLAQRRSTTQRCKMAYSGAGGPMSSSRRMYARSVGAKPSRAWVSEIVMHFADCSFDPRSAIFQ